MERIRVLDQEMASEGFWDNGEEARRLIAEANGLKEWVEPWRGLSAKAGELGELGELLGEEEDAELVEEWEEEICVLERDLGRLELRTMLQGEDDHREAMLTIHPGAGGLESQDWAEMLSRMYMRWSERRGFALRVLDLQPAEEAGIKSVTLEISGDHAYGYLRAERGVHRLVRISPFDSQSRRHTSFASVFVYPVLDEQIEIEIDESDLRIDTFRASGAGGQHVNKTDSAIRITHTPSGIVVSCQQERSQHKNRSTAMKMLRAALYQRAREEKKKEKEALESSKTEIGWGNQIRSYVFAPYTMVNDHRTEVKTGNVSARNGWCARSFHRGVPEEVRGSSRRMSGDGGNLSRVMRTRLEKLEALRARGVEPFAYSCEVTAHAAPSVASFEEMEAEGSLVEGRGAEGRLGRPDGGVPLARPQRLRGSGGPYRAGAGLLQAQRGRRRVLRVARPARSGGLDRGGGPPVPHPGGAGDRAR